jgi:PAS domain S-box-containing protein
MKAQLKVTLPLVLAALLFVLASLAHHWWPENRFETAAAWGALAMVALALYQLQRFVWRPWRAIKAAAPSLSANEPDGALDFSLLAATINQSREQLLEAQTELAAERAARRVAQHALREADERYMLAVRGASDGLWEWDLKSGQTYFSPLWKSLLGFDDSEIGDHINEWHSRIHPEDRARVLQEMEDHLAGHTPRFENEHRLLHKDQSWHWVHARGTAIRHAGGTAYRVVGLHSDVTARRAAEQMLLEVAEALATARGDACFEMVARSFAQVMGVREAFVCEPCDYPPTRARMLAWWCDGRLLPNVEYELEGTPCRNPQVLGRTCYCPKGLEEQWPLEKPFDRTAYLGIPIHDSAGRVIGHIACTDNKPMPERTPHLAIFKLFAERAGVELERRVLLRNAGTSRAEACASADTETVCNN